MLNTKLTRPVFIFFCLVLRQIDFLLDKQSACFENQHQRLIATIKAGRNLAHFIVVDDDYDKTFVRNKPRLIRVGRLPEKTGFEGLGFKIRYDEEKDGHYVDQVFDEGPAKDAGLKVGDRIIQLNGHTTEGIEFEDIYDQLSGFTASQCIMLVTDQGLGLS